RPPPHRQQLSCLPSAPQKAVHRNTCRFSSAVAVRRSDTSGRTSLSLPAKREDRSRECRRPNTRFALWPVSDWQFFYRSDFLSAWPCLPWVPHGFQYDETRQNNQLKIAMNRTAPFEHSIHAVIKRFV